LKAFIQEETVSNPDNKTIVDALQKALCKVSEYYEKCTHNVYCVASILNPDRKMEYLQSLGWSDKSKADARRVFCEVFETYKLKHQSNVNVDVEVAVDPFDSWKPTTTNQSNEVDMYLLSGPVYFNSNMTSLLWWKANEPQYPILASMVRDFFGIQATSAPSERIFSGGVDLVTPNRSSLEPMSITSTMCLKNWLKSDMCEYSYERRGVDEEDVQSGL